MGRAGACCSRSGACHCVLIPHYKSALLHPAADIARVAKTSQSAKTVFQNWPNGWLSWLVKAGWTKTYKLFFSCIKAELT